MKFIETWTFFAISGVDSATLASKFPDTSLESAWQQPQNHLTIASELLDNSFKTDQK